MKCFSPFEGTLVLKLDFFFFLINTLVLVNHIMC